MNRSNLLPIKKSVIDPHKGLILRTYYIRPETLKKVIEELKEKAITYVKDRKYSELYDKIKKTGDVSILSNFFDNQEVFQKLVLHYNEIDKVNSLEPFNYLNIVLNKITSYFLTNDEIYLNKINSEIKKSSYKYELKYNVKETKLKTKKKKVNTKKKNENKNNTIKEQANNNNEVNSIIGKVNTTNIDVLISKSEIGDYVIEYRPYLNKSYQPQRTANILSKYLNFMNPSELKLMTLFKKILGSDFKDNTYVIYNLRLLPHLYYKNEFIDSLIRSIISFNYKAITGLTDKQEEYFYVNEDWTAYYYFLVDSETRKELLNIYPNHIVEILENAKDWNDILNQLSKREHKLIKLLTADKVWIQKNIYSILESSPIDKFQYLKYLSLRKDIPTIISFKLFKENNLKFFDIERAVSNLINYSIFGNLLSYESILLQIIISQLTKEYYIPVFEIDKMNDIFTPYLITKFVKDVKDLELNNIVEYFKKRRITKSGIAELYLNISQNVDYYWFMLDAQIPVRLTPLTVLTEKPYTEHYIKINIKKDKLIQIGEGKYIVHSTDLINHVK